MVKNRVDIITLGCSKNLVDSEQLMMQFSANGYTVKHDAPKISGEIVVVNTCGFIGDAKEESIDMILRLAEAKKRGKIKRLYVMGCLSQRYLQELSVEIPEVDRFYGKFNWKELMNDLGQEYRNELSGRRILTTPSHYAYIKIGEGCNRTCSYCAIPIITGRYRSKSTEEIAEEVRYLALQGVKEFQLIAQDLTYYGKDLYGEYRLHTLVDELAALPGVKWLRLHYAYPAHFPFGLLPVMRENPNVCRYLDIALQHISDPMLKKMRRQVTKAGTYELLERIRHEVPGIHLRTTLMVGHPGESEADFEELKQFVRDARFERMGAFAYSEEEGTYAARHYKEDVPEEVKQERLDELMAIQQEISAAVNESKVGNTFRVIIDREEPDYYIGRTEFDSPEVDPEVLLPKTTLLQPGEFYDVKITSSEAYDLFGEPVSKS